MTSRPVKPAKTTGNETAEPDVLEGMDDLLNERVDSPEITKDTGVENTDKDTEKGMETDMAHTEVDKNDNKKIDADVGDGENNSAKNDSNLKDGDGDLKKQKEMPDIKDAGTGRFVDEEIEKQKEAERQAFQRLIDESAKLDHNLQKTSALLMQTESDRDVFKIQLQTQKEENEQLKADKDGLEEELTMVKAQLKEKESEEVKEKEENGENEQEEHLISMEQRLRDLQLRIKRMAKDEEEKDRRIEHLTKERSAMEEICKQLGKHVDKSKYEEIMAQKESMMQQNGTETKQREETNTVRGNETPPKSKVCSIM